MVYLRIIDGDNYADYPRLYISEADSSVFEIMIPRLGVFYERCIGNRNFLPTIILGMLYNIVNYFRRSGVIINNNKKKHVKIIPRSFHNILLL